MGKQLFTLIICLFLILQLHAQTRTLTGVVTDSLTNEGLPFAALLVKGTTIGTATDNTGHFTLSVPDGKDTLSVSYLGYHTKEISLAAARSGDLRIRLIPDGITLGEVTVKPQREKYSRKDNPAVRLAREVIARRKEHSPYDHDHFSYDHYEKFIFALNDYESRTPKKAKSDRFYFLDEFVDTLDAGTPILPVSEKEKAERVYYRRAPRAERRIVQGAKSSGIDEILSREGVDQFLNEALREIDIFQNNIPLFLQRFVSPLSAIAPAYYKYYLNDTLDIGGTPCADLSFVPFNSETFGFTGHLYVTLDSTYFVKRAVLNVPKDINLNFISRMTIDQTFERTPDSTRLITKDDIQLNFKLIENSKGMYARRLNVYSNHSFDAPAGEEAGVFEEKAPVITLKNAYARSDNFWETARPRETAPQKGKEVSELMEKLRSVKAFYIAEKALSIIIAGYIPTRMDPQQNKFDLGPMNSTVNGNAIEGARFRIGGGTTPRLHPRWFAEGYTAYGTRDGKFKYNLMAEYSFIDRKDYRLEFPVHSLRLEYMYDINKLGQQYMYTSKDNIMLAIKRKKDTRATYLRRAELTYTREHYSGISYGATLRNYREYATPYAEFNRYAADGTARSVPHYDMTALELRFRYAHNERFYQTRTQRIPITYDGVIVNLSHTMARRGFLGSSYDYHRTDIGIQKRFWFSAFGYLDLIAKAGKVWNKVPYPLLILPNANLTYTIQRETYANMNALEFINDEYASWDLTYYMNGNLLNRLPLIKKLELREVFCFRGLWGRLTNKNNPANTANPEGIYAFPEGAGTLGKAPYMEASVGIENILKFMRVDYVWRLNYRDRPDISKSGVRITMKVSF